MLAMQIYVYQMVHQKCWYKVSGIRGTQMKSHAPNDGPYHLRVEIVWVCVEGPVGMMIGYPCQLKIPEPGRIGCVHHDAGKEVTRATQLP